MTLSTILILLAAAVIAVPLFKRLGLGAVLGYLIGGIVIGPSGLKLIGDVDVMLHVSEFGVVMLLFLIGLELKPSRLWLMRKSVFGLGGGQVAFCLIAIAAIAMGFGFDWRSALVAGAGLALSSTAFALPQLAEHNLVSTQMGRDSFAILLFQDLVVIPMAALLPLLGTDSLMPGGHENPLLAVARATGAVALVFLGGRYLIRPLFRLVEMAKSKEIFTATALLVVAGTAALADAVGLSMSLGAFLAGLILADSEYRHEIQTDVEPFQGLLLGLFFLSVGMMADMGLALRQPLQLVGFVLAVMAAKAVIIFILGRISGQNGIAARRMATVLPQGGEFGFVLFSVAASSRIFDGEMRDFLILSVTLSMILSPLVFAANEKLLSRLLSRPTQRDFDDLAAHDDHAQVIICGFGRMGQIIGRILAVRKIPFTALENSAAQVDFVRRFGNKIYYGDPTRPDLLRAAGIEKAKVLVIATDDIESTVKIVSQVRDHYPQVQIIVRARHRQHAFRLMDLGAQHVIRETFHGSLKMAEEVLSGLGIKPSEVESVVDTFRRHDEEMMQRQHAVHTDEAKLIQTSREAMDELKQLFEQDADRKPV